MIRSLLVKELQQHWWAWLLLAAMAALSYLMFLGVSVIHSETPLTSLKNFVCWISLFGGMLLGHRLVVVEYRSRTQLFLESLPLARWHMLVVKYCLGLGVQTLILGAAFLFSCLSTAEHSELTLRFGEIVALRAFSAMWVIYSFFFLMGLLGRYRILIGFVLLIACTLLGQHTSLDFGRLGPFTLLDDTFAFEQELFPWEALWVTWVLGLGFSLLALGLSLTREGSVAAMLAEKMSYREKVFMATLVLGFIFALAKLDDKVRKEPFILANAAIEQRGAVTVHVSSGLADDPAAQRLAITVATELSAVQEYLDLEKVPTVFISLRGDLDAHRFERGHLDKGEGIYVRANFASPEWQDAPFITWLLRETLIVASDGRVELESRRWVLDGFSLFWSTREHTQDGDKQLSLRALYGGFPADELNRWLSFEEKVGPDIAAGVAWFGLRSLADHRGAGNCQHFLRRVLGPQQPKDIRVLLSPLYLERLLAQEAGESYADFLAQWKTDLDNQRSRLAGDLAKLPRLHGQLTFVPLEEGGTPSRQARFQLTIQGSPPRAGAHYDFLYLPLSVFDEPIAPTSLLRIRNACAEQPEDDLPTTFTPGDRLFWAFTMYVPALGCEVSSGAQRQEVP